MSDESWRARHRILTWSLWLEVPTLLVLGLIGPMGTTEAVLLPLAVAFAGAVARLLSSRSARATVTGLGLIAGSFIGIELSGGQVHAHLFILSAIALVSLYQQWAPLLITVGAVVVHHLTLGLMAPERVFSMTSMTVGHDMPMTEALPFVDVLTMVLVHAVAVVIEVIGILMLWHFAEQAERESERVRAHADSERQAAESARLAAAEAEVIGERQRLAENARARDNVTAEAHLIQSRVEDASAAVAHLEEQATQLRLAVQEVSQRCQQAADTAGDGERTAASAADEVRRLERAMGEISEVNQMIAQLAAQTNLLSLNATIEAARAGEMGKGFAVVAQEVKVLANETAASAEKVRGVIDSVVEETEKVARSFATTSALVGDIHRAQNEIATSVEHQAAVLAEVSEQTSTVTEATRDITHGLQRLVDAAVD